MQLKMKDRYTLALGITGSAISWAHINEVLTAIASAFTVFLLGWKIIEKISEHVARKRKNKTNHHHMKKIKSVFGLFALLAVSAAVIVGCTTANPHYSPLNPSVDAITGETNHPAPYVADSSTIQKYIDSAKAVNTATAPVNPYSPITGQAIELVGAAVLAVSGWVAQFRKAKQLNTQIAVTDTMAKGIVKANAQTVVQDVAASTPHFAAVADHINEATP